MTVYNTRNRSTFYSRSFPTALHGPESLSPLSFGTKNLGTCAKWYEKPFNTNSLKKKQWKPHACSCQLLESTSIRLVCIYMYVCVYIYIYIIICGTYVYVYIYVLIYVTFCTYVVRTLFIIILFIFLCFY